MNYLNPKDESALYLAVANENVDIVEYLIVKGKASLQLSSSWWRAPIQQPGTKSPLHIAMSSDNPKLFETLLSLGIKPEISLSDGTTILHEAYENGNFGKIFKRALKLGVDIDAVSEKYGTLIDMAVLKGDVKTVKKLIEFGANVNGVSWFQYLSLIHI